MVLTSGESSVVGAISFATMLAALVVVVAGRVFCCRGDLVAVVLTSGGGSIAITISFAATLAASVGVAVDGPVGVVADVSVDAASVNVAFAGASAALISPRVLVVSTTGTVFALGVGFVAVVLTSGGGSVAITISFAATLAASVGVAIDSPVGVVADVFMSAASVNVALAGASAALVYARLLVVVDAGGVFC